jgi:hypothetical protein
MACLCKAGIVLGVYNDNPSWKVYKTFISHDLKHSAQKEEEQKLQEMVRQEINGFIKTYKYRNDQNFRLAKGGLEEIFGSDHAIVKTFKLLAGAEPNKAKLLALLIRSSFSIHPKHSMKCRLKRVTHGTSIKSMVHYLLLKS